MAFYGYKGDVDNCYWTPYNSSYLDSTPLHYETTFADYNSSSFSSPYQQQELNYSVHTYTEPQTEYYQSSQNYYTVNPSNILQTEPVSYTISSPIEYKISYSVSQFNETEFDEYDTTPYGGGYDIAAAYGKPLPPSDKICYPRTVVPKTTDTGDRSFSDNLPVSVIKPLEEKTPEAKTDNVGNVEGTDALALIPIDEIDKNNSFEHEQEVEKNGMYAFGSDQGYSYYGSGLEAMDICETIFGYWPCVAKMEKREKEKLHEKRDQERRDDSWNVAADYLFGTPNVYTYESYYR